MDEQTKPPSRFSGLERRLHELREMAAERAARQHQANEAEMQRLAPLRARFVRLRERWMGELVVPRLEALARVLPGGGQVERRPGAVEATLKCGRNQEMGFGAALVVSMAPDRDFEGVVIHVQPHFVPMLTGNPPASTRELAISEEAGDALAPFLEDQIVGFAEAYFEAGDVASLYQRERFSTDPVCGMAVHHASAAAVVDYEDRRYYFCAPSCADQFRSDPNRYTRSAEGKPGGAS